MNLLEHHIVKIHREWETPIFPHFINVDLTYDCYGSIQRNIIMFRKTDWEEAKKKGVFLA